MEKSIEENIESYLKNLQRDKILDFILDDDGSEIDINELNIFDLIFDFIESYGYDGITQPDLNEVCVIVQDFIIKNKESLL